MAQLLLVDDDPLILKLYRDGLRQQGFLVETAADGLAAVKQLTVAKPDLMVLDLMMPRFNGVDVLKFARSKPELADLPVILLSNSFMDNLVEEASQLGINFALTKLESTPASLAPIIQDILAENARVAATAPPPAPAPSPPPAPAPAAGQGPTRNPGSGLTQQAPTSRTPPGSTDEAGFKNKARQDLQDNGAANILALRKLFQLVQSAETDSERSVRLQDFFRKVHFVSVMAGMAHYYRVAQLATAFEAMLFELMDRPERFNPSMLRTCAMTLDFMGTLFQQPPEAESNTPPTAEVLVVDDDRLAHRLIVAALRRAQFNATSMDDPRAALEALRTRHYDVVLLDIEMPGMTGFELCQQLRELPSYQSIPVIYVTSHNDFNSRVQSVVSGGDDLISKPVFPMELAVKTISHLLRKQLGPAGKLPPA